MLHDVILKNKISNQLEVVKFFIHLDKARITALYSKLITNPEKYIELLKDMDALLNNDYRPIFLVLNKEELDDKDIILKDCVIINVEKVTPLYAIPGARKIMREYNESLQKPIITNEEKQTLYNPIIENNTDINDSLIKDDNKMVRKLIPSPQE